MQDETRTRYYYSSLGCGSAANEAALMSLLKRTDKEPDDDN